MHTEVQKAWLAGFLDGEGHIGVTLLTGKYGKQRHALKAAVFNTHIPTLESIAIEWPGTRLIMRSRENERPSGEIRWNTDSAVRMLTEIRPYLRTKGEQADLALAFAQTIRDREERTKAITDKEFAAREEIRLALHTRNKRVPEVPRVNNRPPLTCARCGTEFVGYQRFRKYCSKECSMAAGREFYEQRHITERTCPACGNTYRSHSTRQTYCSVKCGLKGNPDIPKGTRADRSRNTSV